MNILVEGETTAQTSDPDRCYYCGHCKAVCPENALDFPGLPDTDFEPILPTEEYRQADRLLLRFRSRRTTRIFRQEAVERQKIEKIILAGQYAPTGTNRQGVEYLVMQSPEALARLKEQAIKALKNLIDEYEHHIVASEDKQALSGRKQALSRYISVFKRKAGALEKGEDRLFYNAPALIFCHTHPLRSMWPGWEAGLASMQMILMAEALELGTCFNGALIGAIETSAELRAAIPIPEEHEIPVCFMVGYPEMTFLRTVYRKPAIADWV
jgi:nitroreductase